MSRAVVGLIVAVLIAPAIPVARAQQTTVGLEEIVVTARKREESLQDIPVVVNALTAEQIERTSIQGLADISLRTPGLNYEGYVSAGLSGGLVLRGLTNTQLTNRTQNVAVFYDGVYLPNQAMFDVGLADIERVEVLKGPQSALYGRNAFAGAVNYISRKPSSEWRGDISATIGSDERQDYAAFVSGPLATDRVFFKLSYSQTESDGTVGNNHPLADDGVSPGNQGNLGGWDNDTFTAGLTIKPVESVEVNLGYFDVDLEREPSANYSLQGAASNLFGLTPFNDLNCLPRTLFPGTVRNSAWCGQLQYDRPDVPGDSRPSGVVVDPRQLGLNGGSSIRTASVRWEINDSLEANYQYGRADYAGIGGGPSDRDPVRGSNINALIGIFNPAAPPTLRNVVDSRPNGDLRADSHELRLQSSAGERFNWLAGAYYSDVSEFTKGLSLFILPLQLDPIADEIEASNQSASRFEDRILAVYGSVDFAFTDQFSAALEARYNDEDKEIFRLTGSTGAPVVNTPASPSNTFQERNYTSTTWRGSLNFKPVESVLTYVSAAKGEKAGGFNSARNPDIQGSFNPETNITYELGLKSEWLDRRLRLNAAVYYVDWEDIQGSAPQRDGSTCVRPPGTDPTCVVPTDANIIENRGGAESTGIEFELGYIFTDNFSATLAGSFNDPKYKDATFLSNLACDGVLCTTGSIVNGVGNGNIDGNTIERQSRTSASLLLTYQQSLANDWGLYGNLDVNYQSKQYLEAYNLGNTGERTLMNARIGVGDEHWDVALWSKNLLDEEYVSNSFVIFFANSYVVGLGDGRSYGVTAKYKF